MIFYKLFHATRMYEKQKLSKLFLSYCHISFLKAITKIYMYCSKHCGSLIKFIRNELFDASLILFNSLIGQSRFQKTLRFQSGQIDLQTTISHDTLSFIDLRKNASSNEQINAINFSPFPHYFSPPPLPIERAITPSQKSPSLPPLSPPSSSRDDFRPGLSCFNTCSAQKSAPRSGDKPDLGAIILESRFFDPLSCKYSPLATPPDSNSFLPSRPQPFRECRFQIAIISSLASAPGPGHIRGRAVWISYVSAPPRNQISLSADYRDVILNSDIFG